MAGATAAPTTTSEVETRVRELRTLAERDPAKARDQAWALIAELGRETARNRAGGSAKLDELFRLGVPPSGIDGHTEGILVAMLIAPPIDAAARAISRAWMPWLGKRFDAGASRGHNVLTRGARLPSKLVWPRYRMRPSGANLAAFEFETAVEPGVTDPGVAVLRLGYSEVPGNPRLTIRPVRDELVEIVPGANLGKILWRGRGGSYRPMGYFALRS